MHGFAIASSQTALLAAARGGERWGGGAWHSPFSDQGGGDNSTSSLEVMNLGALVPVRIYSHSMQIRPPHVP